MKNEKGLLSKQLQLPAEQSNGEIENHLVLILGEDELKIIGEQLAEIVRLHNLQHFPAVCRMLFSYMSDVIDGWNRV